FSIFSISRPSAPNLYTLPLHDALPISLELAAARRANHSSPAHKSSNAPARTFSASRAMSPDSDRSVVSGGAICLTSSNAVSTDRSEEHTSELQSQSNLVCRLLLEKKNQ